MRIFVAGREGQVARCLIDATPPAGVDIISAGRPDFDLRNIVSVASAIAQHRPDVVINAAAYTQVDKAESDEAAAFAVNAEGAGNIAQVCADRDIPLIHLSTDYVFDGEKDAPYSETDEVAPINAYGRSKLAGECFVAATCEKHLIVRTSWVYSRYGSNFLLTMLRLAGTQPKLNVVADQFGAPTYAPDLAEALVALARRVAADPDTAPWDVYHAAGAGETSWYDFARAIFAEASERELASADVAPIPTADYPTPAKRPTNSRLDCRKLAAAFGIGLPDWQPSLRRAIARVADDRSADGAGR